MTGFTRDSDLMGIRFACPNGHRLNVKADLAGKRAICPNCGARVVVPAPDDTHNPPQAAAAKEPAAAPSREDAPSAAAPEVATVASPPSVATPPTSETHGATWYVRPPAGGQYGPAAEDMFRDWIADGRVTADAYVWREGWADWKLAQEAADDLPAPLPDTPADAADPTTPPPPPDASSESADKPKSPADKTSAVENLSPTARYAARRRRMKQVTLQIVLMMLLAALVLAAILIWIVQRGGSEQSALFERRPTEIAQTSFPLAPAFSGVVSATRSQTARRASRLSTEDKT